jgi:hypothetical protein
MLLVLELQDNALAAAGYGSDKAIFAYGNTGSNVSISNLV